MNKIATESFWMIRNRIQAQFSDVHLPLAVPMAAATAFSLRERLMRACRGELRA